MFAIPDEDEFWDDFCLDEDSRTPSTEVKTSNRTAGSSGNFSKARTSNCPDDGAIYDSVAGSSSSNHQRPDAVTSPAPPTPTVNKRRSERKFPGPAGLLPAMPSPEHLSSSSALELVGIAQGPSTDKQDNEEMPDFPSSQSQTEDVSNMSQWKRMTDDLGDDAQTLLTKFSIKSLLLRASRKMLSKGKAPLVFGVIENMDMQGSDAGFVIRDQTGKMKGSLHRDLIQDPSTALQAGSVLILRQVSVISPSTRTHYLNVTPMNVVFVYAPTKDAAVAKRPWPCSNSSELMAGDFKSSPSLQEIIAESERELSESIHNFHNKRLSSCSSQMFNRSSQNLNSPQLFSTGALRQAMPNNNSRGFQARPLRPLGNSVPFGRGLSRLQAANFNPVPRFPNNCLNESPIPTGNSPSVPCFRQPLSGAVTTGRLPGSNGYIISGEVAVRHKPAAGHSGYQAGASAASHSHNNLRNTDPDFDFPEDEDGELLQFCEETASNHDNVHHGLNSETFVPNQFRVNDSAEPASQIGVTSNVISNVFKDCANENRNKSPGSQISDFDCIRNSNNANVERTSASSKTFTFKRPAASLCNLDTSANFSKRKYISDQARLTISAETEQSAGLGDKSKRLGVSGERQQRDSRVQLGQRTLPAELPTLRIDSLSHWDDDLTDDILLSQLSEEF